MSTNEQLRNVVNEVIRNIVKKNKCSVVEAESIFLDRVNKKYGITK